MAILYSILVTGGAGFIGHYLVKRLLDDYRVVIIDNLSSGKSSNIPNHHNFIFYKEDVRNKETISDIIKREKIDTCIHLAAKTSVIDSINDPDETHSINTKGTLSVLEACSNNNVKNFVFASSAAVYGEPRVVPVFETHQLKPLSPYGESKAAGESLLSSYRTGGKIKNAVSLRFFNVYGAGQNPAYAGVITKFAERLTKGLAPIIYGNGKQTRDFVSVNDVVDAIILAAESEASGVFNIASGKPVSINELANTMIRIAGLNLKPVYQKANEGEIIHSQAEISKSANVLGFKAKEDLEKGLHQILIKSVLSQPTGKNL